MSGSGKGGDNRGNRRKHFRSRDQVNNQPQNLGSHKNTGKSPIDLSTAGEGKSDRKRAGQFEHPRWIPPKPPAVTLPTASCVWCDKPIKDISTAISEPNTGKPVHFDCVLNRIIEGEILDSGDTVSYIGGGRFGIIHFNNPPDTRDFRIKKVLEWENRENRSEWREIISDYFTVT
jgi:hypothetical protein